ncbi:hypothetical protein CDL12_14149 [Handroanthus impetiginosus]|uniref:Pectinesterase inhibitor domain-containing protein n=1 Tax=Handroanthus impetiginosus TaxID=429701 RepID=A0A2G9H6Y0_9LAMI|nr:hypothetical protein CDL12_14149 [Handroanthus impetiginosus]
MKLSLLTTFLIFLILLTNSITFANPKATITDELINKICSQTKNPSFCLNNLKPLNGKRLPNSIAALRASSVNKALSHGNSTAALIWARYHAITELRNESKLRLMYYKCFVKYNDVMKHLKEAKRFTASGIEKSIKNHIFVVVDRVSLCNDELVKGPKDEVKPILEANEKLKDFCSIIEAICDKVKY